MTVPLRRRWAVALAIMFSSALIGVGIVKADSGTIANLHGIEDGSKAQATFTVTRDPCPGDSYCGWFPFATTAAATSCGSAVASKTVWVGKGGGGPGTEVATDDFYVEGPLTRVCLSLNSGGSEKLLAEAVYESRPLRPPKAELLGEHGPNAKGEPSDYLQASVDGCWDGKRYSINNFDCVTLLLRLTRNGRVLNTEDFWDEPHDSAAGYLVTWTCQNPGRYEWQITYTNGSYEEAGATFRAVKTGAFRVPRCRSPQARRVGTASAQSTARKAGTRLFPRDAVSATDCTPVGTAPAPRWRCVITHNSETLECRDRVTIVFFSKDRWGRSIKGYTSGASRRIRCKRF